MRYLVTGAAGFLGTNLSLGLLSEGHEVVGMDNMSTGTQYNLAMLKKNKGFSFVRHDVVKPYPARLAGIEFIYNLACPASPLHYQKDPLQTFRTSVWGVWNALEFAALQSIPLVHASTSEIYGDPAVHPQAEGYWGNVNPIGTRACYDEGKRGAEALLMDYRRMHGAPVKIVRIFNTYGPFMDPNDGRLVSNFLVQAILGKPLTIYGSGSQTRSLCYVDDLIEALRLMEKSPGNFTGPINIGNPSELTVLELAGHIERIAGRRLGKKIIALPSDDPLKRKPDITLAKKVLGWEPRTPLDEGLGRTLEYFRERIGVRG